MKKIAIPTGKYIKTIEVNDDGLNVSFAKKKRIALLFISINERYWPYLKQVIEDCQTHFLPQHNVDYFVWSDIPEEDTPEYKKRLEQLLPQSVFDHAVKAGTRPQDQWFSRETIENTVSFLRSQKNIHINYTDPIDWPAPTLMRYHLFLNEEEKLKDYDYIFYLDADMRVVSKISDEVLGKGLTAAEHPMYSLRPQYIPPYEPNKTSTAYIPRLGKVIDDKGKPRFKPYYVAGGFQGGVAYEWLKAMKKMKSCIDKDFMNNYTAIWNDESHWNKYMWDYKGDYICLSPSYVYPDSLVKEYYEPLWGCSYEPKIVTLTKPFSLSADGGKALNEFLDATGNKQQKHNFQCPTCKENFVTDKRVIRVVECPGVGKQHAIEMEA